MNTRRLRPLTDADLACIRGWRNAPSVRAHLFTTQEISADEHRRWFDKLSVDTSRRLWLYERDGRALGFVQLSGVAPGGIADWGFYAAPDAPRGSGRAMGRLALAKAFGEEQLHKVCGQTLAGNTASIRCHLALGFRAEGVLREQHRDAQGGYHDIHCFGLLRHDAAVALMEPAE